MTILIKPNSIFQLIEQKAKTWFMENKQKWNCAFTLDGMDYQEYGNSKEEAIHNLANRIINSDYLAGKAMDLINNSDPNVSKGV